jgi:gas vesicle protein
MSDEKRRHEMADDDEHRSKHPFAYGALAGAAIGVGVGLLVAPRRGSELRHEMGTQLAHVKSSCASGLIRAKVKASDWGHKGRDAYQSTRRVVGKGAHETQRYLSDVAGAVTMKSRRQGEAAPRQPETARQSEYLQKSPEQPAVKAEATPSPAHERPRPSLAAKSS